MALDRLEFQTTRWFNAEAPPTPESLTGKVVALHAFQMLCPGCVSHGLPQAQRIAKLFSPERVAVIGLHTVFEHHDVMTPDALEAFIHEYQLTFPIGVDQPSDKGDIPRSMAAYAMRGTPSLLLFDRDGRLRWHEFGRPEDMAVGAQIAQLVGEPAAGTGEVATGSGKVDCDDEGCAAPAR